jgi:putative redox protein
MLSVTMDWRGGLKFKGDTIYGNEIITDGAKAIGGTEEGYKPTELLLYAIAGCTGIDVVRIMEKQRQKLTSLRIEVDGHQPDDFPKPFHNIEIRYIVSGENIDPKKLAKAIELSEEKYCAVSNTVRHAGQVKCSYEIISEKAESSH